MNLEEYIDQLKLALSPKTLNLYKIKIVSASEEEINIKLTKVKSTYHPVTKEKIDHTNINYFEEVWRYE